MNARHAVVLAALLPALAGARDLGPGTWEVTGGTRLGLSNVTLEPPGSPDVETRTVTFDTSVGYYVANNFGLGLLLDWQKEEIEIGTASTETTTSMIGPIATYDIPVSANVSVVASGGIVRMAVDVDGNDADGFGVLLGGGLRLFATRNVAFDATLSFLLASVEDDLNNEIDISGFDLGLGIAVFFGG
jgi:hypothetical protein